ncbi:diguanylate cyclase [Desulfuromonas sp. DDH964]|uniref:GGDEF domain-containing protein n=1 Tax=Desulfuromonas sp. DDH964 TaxID=1823759 RepID=UPI00078C9448|nr:GGDEF domain-containing protein [Desulfuromonas sp. DDH964]AMV71356.1 diguanylate cyclase [Desulfuromonas sp. DDH964]
MPTSARKTGYHLLIPGGLITALVVSIARFLPLPPGLQAFLPFYPLLVLGAGLFFGWRFNRSRLLFALLLLVIAERTLALAPAPEFLAALRLLLPLNLALVAGFSERGLFTLPGLLRLLLIGLQPVAVAALHLQRPGLLQEIYRRPLLPGPLPFVLPPPLTEPLLLVLLISAALLLFWLLRRPGPLEGGFVWATGLSCYPLLVASPGAGASVAFASAGLILVAAVIELSYSMAFRDELTGLPARRSLNEALLRVGRRYTLAMVDVDHFKKVNDRYGHDVGDQVLKMVAARLARVKGGGRAFRYGGEEFTVLFPGKDAATALPHLEALHQAIAAAGFTLRDAARPAKRPQQPPARTGSQRLSVTASIGVAERQPGQHPEQVIKAADQALYKAKQTGRNRICGAGEKAGKGIRTRG